MREIAPRIFVPGYCRSVLLSSLVLSILAQVALMHASDEPKFHAKHPASLKSKSIRGQVNIPRGKNTPDSHSGNKKIMEEEKCWIDKEALRKLLTSGDAIVIDVRPEKSFESCHIPDSINMPRSHVRSSGWIKGKKVVIVGSGMESDREIVDLRRLATSDMNVKILKGGIAQWSMSANLPLMSCSPEAAVPKISPVRLRRIINERSWRALQVKGAKTSSNSGNESQNDIFRPHDILAALETETIALSPKEDDFEMRLKAVLEKTGNGKTLLVYTMEGNGYLRIYSALKSLGRENVLFLKGGARAFNQFANQFLVAKPVQLKTTTNSCGCGK